MTLVQFPQLPHNEHLQPIAAHFHNLAIAPDEIPRHEALVLICYTNRSGSSYLAHALHSSGRLNLAVEMLNCEQVLADTRLRGHARFADYVAAQMMSRLVAGRFAMKVALPHLEILGASGLLDHCPHTAHFVFIERSDRLGQAISYEIARQTARWSSEIGARPDGRDPTYSRQALIDAIEMFAELNRQFDRFFGRNGIVPQHVLYERLVVDPGAEVRAIGAKVGLADLAVLPARITLQRQAGPTNSCWRELFLAGE